MMQRIIDIMQALPLLVMALVAAACWGVAREYDYGDIYTAGAPGGAVIQVEYLSLKNAVRRSGAGARDERVRIALKHILPNTLAPFIVLATAQTRLSHSARPRCLSSAWAFPNRIRPGAGCCIRIGGRICRTAPWLVIFPGIAISLAVFGTNLLGDAGPTRPAAAQLSAEGLPETRSIEGVEWRYDE